MASLVATVRAREAFDDARAMYVAALERLAAGDIRDAAEKAWCATLQATNAVIYERTGTMPEKTPNTSRELYRLAEQTEQLDTLVGRYYTRQGQLHGQCFYLGLCEPLETTERRIRETITYIEDAERFAEAHTWDRRL